MASRAAFSFFCGLLFGGGLAVSGMTNPARVRGFLDIFGAFDPTLGFVMIGALIPMIVAWRVRRGMRKPLYADAFNLPSARMIDRRLVSGSLLFGVGWGLAGVCPGPAIADFALEPLKSAPFVLAMALGMRLHRLMLDEKQ